jgi:hypothetical protein
MHQLPWEQSLCGNADRLLFLPSTGLQHGDESQSFDGEISGHVRVMPYHFGLAASNVRSHSVFPNQRREQAQSGKVDILQRLPLESIESGNFRMH